MFSAKIYAFSKGGLALLPHDTSLLSHLEHFLSTCMKYHMWPSLTQQSVSRLTNTEKKLTKSRLFKILLFKKPKLREREPKKIRRIGTERQIIFLNQNDSDEP